MPPECRWETKNEYWKNKQKAICGRLDSSVVQSFGHKSRNL